MTEDMKYFRSDLKNKLKSTAAEQLERDLKRSKLDRTIESVKFDGEDYICRFSARIPRKSKPSKDGDTIGGPDYKDWTQSFSNPKEMYAYFDLFFGDEFEQIIKKVKA